MCKNNQIKRQESKTSAPRSTRDSRTAKFLKFGTLKDHHIKAVSEHVSQSTRINKPPKEE